MSTTEWMIRGIMQLSDGKILVNAFRRSFAPAASVESRTDVRLARVEPISVGDRLQR